MKVQTKVELDGVKGMIPAGTVIDLPDAWRLCNLGVADPIDEEANAKHAEFVAVQQKIKDVETAKLNAIIEAAKAQKVAAATVETDEFAKKLEV